MQNGLRDWMAVLLSILLGLAMAFVRISYFDHSQKGMTFQHSTDHASPTPIPDQHSQLLILTPSVHLIGSFRTAPLDFK